MDGLDPKMTKIFTQVNEVLKAQGSGKVKKSELKYLLNEFGAILLAIPDELMAFVIEGIAQGDELRGLGSPRADD